MGWATFWAIFSQTHLVTLSESYIYAFMSVSNITSGTYFEKNEKLKSELPASDFAKLNLLEN
jgi:hypothetical protein